MSNLSNQVINEQRLIELMLADKEEQKTISEMSDSRADNLVVRIMTEKINNNYSNMNPEQKKILREYAVYGSSDSEEFELFLKSMKKNSLKSLSLLKENTENKVLLSKIDEVVTKINNLVEINVADDDIAKYLKVSELKFQLRS